MKTMQRHPKTTAFADRNSADRLRILLEQFDNRLDYKAKIAEQELK